MAIFKKCPCRGLEEETPGKAGSIFYTAALWVLVVFCLLFTPSVPEGTMAFAAPPHPPPCLPQVTASSLIDFPKLHPHFANSPFPGWLHKTVAYAVA